MKIDLLVNLKGRLKIENSLLEILNNMSIIMLFLSVYIHENTNLMISYLTATKGSRNKPDMAVPDRASVFLELCEVYRLNNQPNEAATIMTQAMTEFQVTTKKYPVCFCMFHEH